METFGAGVGQVQYKSRTRPGHFWDISGQSPGIVSILIKRQSIHLIFVSCHGCFVVQRWYTYHVRSSFSCTWIRFGANSYFGHFWIEVWNASRVECIVVARCCSSLSLPVPEVAENIEFVCLWSKTGSCIQLFLILSFAFPLCVTEVKLAVNFRAIRAPQTIQMQHACFCHSGNFLSKVLLRFLYANSSTAAARWGAKCMKGGHAHYKTRQNN